MSASQRFESPNYTYEDYCLWEGQWELIQGMPYAMVPAPVKIHQRLALQIGSALLSELSDCLHCEVGWRMFPCCYLAKVLSFEHKSHVPLVVVHLCAYLCACVCALCVWV